MTLHESINSLKILVKAKQIEMDLSPEILSEISQDLQFLDPNTKPEGYIPVSKNPDRKELSTGQQTSYYQDILKRYNDNFT